MAMAWGWYEPERILYFKISGDMSVEDFRAMVTITSNTVRDNPGVLLHTLTDYQDLVRLPRDLRGMADAIRDTIEYQIPGWAVTVGGTNSAAPIRRCAFWSAFSANCSPSASRCSSPPNRP